jgi:hypothetical protein
MEKALKKKKPTTPKTQAERLLEVARNAKVDQGGRSFSQVLGKQTLRQNARKTGKGQVGGSNV